MSDDPQIPVPMPQERWVFFRDVAVFLMKLALGNIQNFLLLPVSLIAAITDLIFRREKEGFRFYKVMEWARQTDEMINIYGAIGGYHSTGSNEPETSVRNRYSVDSVVARVESAVIREYEKGGTAATMKSAVDRVIDELQKHGDRGKSTFDNVVKKASTKFSNDGDKNTD